MCFLAAKAVKKKKRIGDTALTGKKKKKMLFYLIHATSEISKFILYPPLNLYIPLQRNIKEKSTIYFLKVTVLKTPDTNVIL